MPAIENQFNSQSLSWTRCLKRDSSFVVFFSCATSNFQLSTFKLNNIVCINVTKGNPRDLSSQSTIEVMLYEANPSLDVSLLQF